MIKESRKLNVQDMSGKGKDLELLVNWTSVVKDCKYIQFKIGQEKCVIKKEHFLYLSFLIADDAEQDKIIVAELTNVQNRNTIITIQATKDIKKGEELNIPVTISTNPKTGEVQLK